MLTIFTVGYKLLISYNLPFMYTVLTVNLEYENGFEVGRHHKINCTVYIVDHTNVSINWGGRNDLITNESGRKNAIPTTSNGYIHIRKSQFSSLNVYLLQETFVH